MKKIIFLLIGLAFTMYGLAQSQTVNIGSTANDGTGDNLRTAFTKVNTNFGEVSDSLTTIRGELNDLVNLVFSYHFTAPTISIGLSPSTTVYEIGTSNSITISGSTTNPESCTLSAGLLLETNATPDFTVNDFGSATSYTSNITFAPTVGGASNYTEYEYKFKAEQNYELGAIIGTATSSIKTIYGVFPVFYFTSAENYTTGNINIQTLEGAGETITTLVEREGNKTATFYSDHLTYAYLLFPMTWVDETFSSIKDNSNFETLGNWTKYSVTVTNASKYTTEDYILYRFNNLAEFASSTYTFTQ